MGMMERRMALLHNQPDLPPIYKKVDYLVSVAQGAHIDTGVAGSENLQIECEFLAETQYNYAGILGNFVSNTKSWRIILHANAQTIAANAYSQNGTILSPVSGSSIGTKLSVLIDTSSVSVTDSAGTAEKTPSAIAGSDNSNKIALGRYAVNKNVSGITQTYRIRIYGCKIWEGGTLIRAYIPCVRALDNKAGFYDTVNHTFSLSVSQYDFVVDAA